MRQDNLHELIRLALAEDLGECGDVTAEYFLQDEPAQGRIFSKESKTIIVSGLDVAAEVFAAVDPNLQVELLCDNGAEISKGQTLLEVSGSKQSILTAERTVLNFLQRLCGVATLTKEYSSKLKAGVQLLDTRKTTPAYRYLEKEAVMHGGGGNHRMGLFDAVMIKDNHLVGLSDLSQLQGKIDRFQKRYPDHPIIIEADTKEQVEEFLKLKGVSRVLLDNMTTELLKECVKLVNKKVELEASGGITLENIAEVSETGVDFISVGALTYSARAVDLSLEL